MDKFEDIFTSFIKEYKKLIKEDVNSLSGQELVQPICDNVETTDDIITTEDIESVITEWDEIIEEDIEIDDDLN